ncbi:hypothetical protein PS627_04470 [Pseudomonas fluorescens]|uniref:hypothetical protein n=1 Tax=Pseudomonas fluorescens TaxID=294 RepID=UPI00125A222F|nr:hypothetical protein [Pseudomonas fluorescens]CAG8871513.1 hypothetical protein PS627_04470 [Pseudomonas fluorescens]
MLQNLKIALLTKEQNVWFIRAEKGKYAKHFRAGGVIAIEHLERAYRGNIPNELPTEEFLKAQLLTNEKYSEFRDNTDGKESRKLNRSGFNVLSQIKRFANEIKCGDLIVTRNEKDDGYSFGICSETIPYIDHVPIRVPVTKKDGTPGFERSSLNYKLRKRVIWGPSISRSELPGAVRKATSGQQTVTSLNNHKEKIFHLIYPFFTDGESLFFSNKIKTNHRVNALAVGKLFQNVALIKSLSETLLSEEYSDLSQLTQLIESAILLGKSDIVTCQAEFMSPGDMWCRIPLIGDALTNQIFACVLSCLLLTGQVKAEEIASLTNNEAVPTLTVKKDKGDIFTDRYKTPAVSQKLKSIAKAAGSQAESIESQDHSITEVKKSLNLSITKVDTEKLEGFEFGINVLEIGKSHENR